MGPHSGVHTLYSVTRTLRCAYIVYGTLSQVCVYSMATGNGYDNKLPKWQFEDNHCLTVVTQWCTSALRSLYVPCC